MDIAHLREYLVLADCLNFNTAARRLYISQPTLSRHVQGIEDECGLRLLERDRQGVALTPAGEAVRRHFERALSAYEDALRAAADAGDPRARTVRMVSPPLYVRFPLAHDLMVMVGKRYPDLCVRGSFSGSDDAVALLLDGAVDAALAPIPYGMSIPGVNLVDIGETRLHLITSASANLEVDSDLTALKGADIAVPASDPRIRGFVVDLLGRVGVSRERVLPCDSMDEALASVMSEREPALYAIGFDIGDAFSHVLRCAPLRGQAFVMRACLATRDGDSRAAVADLMSCAKLLGETGVGK